ncbi:extensin-1-like [Pyrus ussuriensis x Pyrus communis]|uniref:Extensin-1-like n=1 Tax=Pyrus ussuriensis x Pyrus communis TaxID=2448454 RepID=A0A5N5FHP3_9ROSA|nr:extensin-1-like [Pyrus ussuriensis x Pyrus communis]
MKIFQKGFWLCVLFVSFCYAEQTVEVLGVGECTDCDQNSIKTSRAFSGLRVTIDCKPENGHFKTRGVGKLNEHGEFKVSLPKKILKEENQLKEDCYAQLHSASAVPCAAHDGLKSTKIVFKSKASDGTQTFGVAGGKLKFSPVTCNSAFFWPHKKHPFFSKLPHLPKLPHFPPKVFPPKVPIFKKPLPPPIPIYKKPLPPPIPVHKKPLPPPIPVYKKPLPPPVPIYKKPLPPLVPIYKKPLPPPVPIYKKPLPPLVPIYKNPNIQEASSTTGPNIQKATSPTGPNIQEASSTTSPNIQKAISPTSPHIQECTRSLFHHQSQYTRSHFHHHLFHHQSQYTKSHFPHQSPYTRSLFHHQSQYTKSHFPHQFPYTRSHFHHQSHFISQSHIHSLSLSLHCQRFLIHSLSLSLHCQRFLTHSLRSHQSHHSTQNITSPTQRLASSHPRHLWFLNILRLLKYHIPFPLISRSMNIVVW